MSVETITGSIQTTLRPLRFGFVIKPGDRASALHAMQLSSFLWGGDFNPIIPFYRRIPNNNPEFRGATSGREVFQGMLDAFDPDFIVRLGDAKAFTIDFGNRTEIEVGDLQGREKDGYQPEYGIGLFEVLRSLFEEEFRFVRRNPVTFKIPDVGNSLFWHAVFGGLSPAILGPFQRVMAEFPGWTTVSCTAAGYHELFKSDNYFLRRLAYYKLNYQVAKFRNDWIYLGDERSLDDVLTYWNLRALGWNLYPVPLSAAKDETSIEKIAERVESCSWPHRHNATLFNHATLLKAPSVEGAEFEAFADEVIGRIPENRKQGEPIMIRQSWIPRMWSEWDRRHNRGGDGVRWMDSQKIQMDSSTMRFDVPALTPPFVERYTLRSRPRCANELHATAYGDSGRFAEVIPEGGQSLVGALDRYLFDEIRCSRNGIVNYPSRPDSNLRLNLPEAERVFGAWLKERGWEVELSDNGLITQHLIKQVGGLWGSRMLTDEKILTLLYKISKDKWLDDETFRREVNMCSNASSGLSTSHLAEWLVEKEIVKLGIDVTCPDCRQRSWYSISAADYELQCGQCLGTFKLPAQSTKEIRWAYRGNGAFASKEGTQGSLPVVLAMRLFKEGMSRQVTGLLSSNLSRGDEKLEMDLGLMSRQWMSQRPQADLLFFECKSYNKFEKRDVDRLECFVRSIPGSIMVFATLRRELAPNEIQMLTKVEKRSRVQRRRGDLFPPLIILTGNELFSLRDPWSTWSRMDEKFVKVSSWVRGDEEMLTLATATQWLYLNLEPYRERVEG